MQDFQKSRWELRGHVGKSILICFSVQLQVSATKDQMHSRSPRTPTLIEQVAGMSGPFVEEAWRRQITRPSMPRVRAGTTWVKA